LTRTIKKNSAGLSWMQAWIASALRNTLEFLYPNCNYLGYVWQSGFKDRNFPFYK